MTASASPLRLLFVAGERPDSEIRAALDEQIDSYTLDTEQTAADALDTIRSESVDCVVSEYELPESDGLTFLQSVREIDSNLPFILVPADGDESIASVATEHGVSRYLPRETAAERLATNIVESVGHRLDLEQRVTRYEQILESLDDAVYAIEPDRTIVYVNERYAQMKGVDRSELLGTDIDRWISRETKQKVAQIRKRVASGDRAVGVLEYDFLTADGETFPAELRFTSVPDGDAFDRAGVIRDVSERVAREQSLRETNERLEEFASIVSHDLRNPLDVAQTRLELARTEADSEQLDEIGTALDRMERLLEELLALAQQGQTIDEPGPVSLKHLATTAWAAVDTADATLDIESPLTLLADDSRLEQLFENLYRNAITHAGPTATVCVGALPGDEGFYIADDGPGIPDEKRTDIFESGYSTTPDGTGFGLSIVEEIADAHGWAIDVSDSDHDGARFEFVGVDLPSR
ncbi:ATP-binding protein [Halovenus sp. HT40]|uniref:ATP-binding protein n=1 Tax=Halovenus sp. HT40 TaxID=3126691 RepID=UPI00300F0B67